MPVAHRPHDPGGTARRLDGTNARLRRLPLLAGLALLVSAVLPLLQG